MDTCFVMQPFDQGDFDLRYEEVIKPAIEDAGLQAYRVDQDPQVSIPIKDIEKGIQDSTICLAEITKDNPNVWFELGYAIACNKLVVLICSDERTSKFPFDVQHRSIIRYQTGSRQAIDQLQSDITTKVKAYITKAERLITLSERTISTEYKELKPHEVVCLATITENIDHPSDHVMPDAIKADMTQSGFTKAAASIALKSLLTKGLINEGSYETDYNNYDAFYTAFYLTDSGWEWITENEDQFALRQPPPSSYDPDDIPF